MGWVVREGTLYGKSTVIELVQRLRERKVHFFIFTTTTTTIIIISILCYVFVLYITFF